jgi:hypothetical protein
MKRLIAVAGICAALVVADAHGAEQNRPAWANDPIVSNPQRPAELPPGFTLDKPNPFDRFDAPKGPTLVPVEGDPFADLPNRSGWRDLLPAALAAVIVAAGAYAVWRWGRRVTTTRVLAALAAFWIAAGVVGFWNSLNGLSGQWQVTWAIVMHAFAATLLIVRVFLLRIKT